MEYSATNIKEINFEDVKYKKRKWSEQEVELLSGYIEQGMSLQEISDILNRTVASVFTKGNTLDYGYFTNKNDGLKYFKSTINHKNRRTKGEMMEGKEFVSVPESKDSESNIEIASDIIPKIEINLIDLDIAIQILTMARSNVIDARTDVDG